MKTTSWRLKYSTLNVAFTATKLYDIQLDLLQRFSVSVMVNGSTIDD